jgi:hypothetical protein
MPVERTTDVVDDLPEPVSSTEALANQLGCLRANRASHLGAVALWSVSAAIIVVIPQAKAHWTWPAQMRSKPAAVVLYSVLSAVPAKLAETGADRSAHPGLRRPRVDPEGRGVDWKNFPPFHANAERAYRIDIRRVSRGCEGTRTRRVSPLPQSPVASQLALPGDDSRCARSLGR